MGQMFVVFGTAALITGLTLQDSATSRGYVAFRVDDRHVLKSYRLVDRE